MRIVMIGQKGIPTLYGGIERHVEELALELAKQGHEILVYARSWYTPKNIKNYKGIRIIHTPTIHTKHLDAIAHTFTATIHALFQKADIIHYHGVGPSLLSFIPRLLSPRTKIISTFHCIDRYHQKWGVIARMALTVGEWAACHFPHQTIAVSRTIQNYCLNEFQKHAAFIPNGAQKAGACNSKLIEEWSLAPEKYILMVSRLVRHKGAHYLLEAWQYARQLRPELFADYKLAIVGGSAFTDDYVNELHQIARGDNSIVFTGWQKGRALDELYGNAKLFVNPSENEGLPLTVLQAMSFGRPVLVSDIPEHQEIIPDQRFQAPVANLPALTNKLIELWQNPAWLKEAGIQNKNLVEEKYQWNDIAKQVEETYAAKNKKPFPKLKTA